MKKTAFLSQKIDPLKKNLLHFYYTKPHFQSERAKGIEPSCVAWKATVLPLNYARMSNRAMLSDPPDKCNSEVLRTALSRRAGKLADMSNAVRRSERSRVTPHFQAIA